MPPARKRPRAYDPAKTRKAVLAQFGHVREAVGVLSEEQLALPTRLGEWTVRDLAAHLTTAVESVSRALERPEPPKAELNPLDHASATAAHASAIAEGSHHLAEVHPDLAARYADVERRITDALEAAPQGRIIDTRAGGMLLDDYLVTRTIELVVHTDDLNAAVPGLDVPVDRAALATCVRVLADTLAARAPGGSTEVRIPPYAVVQCVEGPRHTRGTPPNVVETDPLTWIRLATGRAEWAAALDAAEVSASGERADLSGLLPLMR
ncbi:sterol carrier family protein [Streptomyces caniscabiei]|uniref:Maleylpyruvate isomerase family mycothiol-dependent enzyme n=2 Tax=Streptomyces caniscabiei TaxID=2746961 RepID=A0A927LEL2_9ACTN|nr:maleylpyruvate isomerase family mycothiol-dependent enzyme [Streptomyces caniscabiei]MBD9729681.1 maleylpyruvate isomerase family mycothiol-dependent enzyme [Streptomyces caniscabiei]MDX3515644.1 sterol carrier family protein [Streptomyces caniscabiei]MDX3724594.1 sterol carrier family protein [Streptomyces caniscabiei]WEO25897.1 sterol carrier family protein [Streptomyces caniscabiei]